MKLGKKLLLILLSVVVVVFLLYQGYLQIHFRMYNDYKQYIKDQTADYEAGSAFAPLSGGGKVPDMELAAENEFLQLYVDIETTNVAVYDKRTGTVTYACPPDADDDEAASALNKSVMKSPIVVDFFNARRTAGRYNAYDRSIKDNQFAVEKIENGLRVVYTLGDLSVSTGIVPLYIHEDRLNSFLEKLDDPKDRNEVIMRYVKSSVAPDGFLELLEGAKGAATIRKLTEILTRVGYTEEDLLEDSMASGVEGAMAIGFEVPLEYRLEGDSLVVSVPTDHIVEKGGAKISTIQVLRFFGAADTEEDGYVLVPNGSGSLINFNNGKTHVEDYNQYVYGLDALASDYVVLGNTEMARLPVFGIQTDGVSCVFAQVEEGQTLAQITASVSGKSTSYNNAYATFTVRGSASLVMFGVTGNEGELPVVETDIYKVNLTVRYSFLSGEYDGYSGMARYYRERLEREGVLQERTEQGDIPFYYDLIGAVTGTKFMLSVQYQGSIPMTTYQQAGEIVDLFLAGGIANQVVNYQGWFNRGYYHDVPDKINMVRQLGNKSQFEELASKLEAQGGKLYADVVFQEVTFQSKRFNYPMETSRYYGGGQVAARALVDPLDYEENTTLGYIESAYDLLSPKFLSRYVDAFLKRFDSYNVTGISLRDLGSRLHSDRKRTELINREQALSIVLAQLDKLSGQEKDVMLSGGNLYALSSVDDLINIPLTHNDFYVVDDEVPFYQMVIHGYIPYTGYAVNRSDAFENDVEALRLLEYGASPHFTFTWEEASEMKYTGLNRFYGTHVQNWVDSAVGLYNTVNPVLSRVSDSTVIAHEITPDGLRCVTYDNGIQIIVNYTSQDLSYQGVTVTAKGFAVREGVAA